ncbi:hypothetical protein [Actibacterium sp. XHP0104]|uniref:hypothetical protein n=1 Tax=Actibacterium sp. XHP0104 TaxID=2984335 RepID=UPI0021E8F497|nr:hypothetical protein [Actibacterium sp. XHP0104]MCV2881668.1 hypothetical protein [Actibacterium sp. XHP0104]
MRARLSRGLILTALVPVLAGCLQGGVSQQATLGRGAVVITAPQGYCVDNRGSDESFVLMASCASVTRNADAPRPLAPALLTVTVTPRGPGEPPITQQVDRLSAYFRSTEGRAALSRGQEAGDVQILSARLRQGMFVLHARDKASADSAGPANDQWRAIFNVDEFIVSASVTALEGQPISSDAGAATLTALTERIRPAGAAGN